MWVPDVTVHYYITENIIRWVRRQPEQKFKTLVRVARDTKVSGTR